MLTSVYAKIFRTVTRNAVNEGVWRKKNCSWPPLNKYAMNVWLSSLRIRAHLSWRTGKHLHVLHVLRTYSTCSYPGYQDTTTYAALASRRPKKSNWREHALAAAQICFSEIDQIYSVTCDCATVLRIIIKCQWLWKMDNSILYIHAIWNRPSVFFFLENKRDCDGNLVTEHDMDICGWVRHSRHDTARASKSSWHSWDCKEIQKYTNNDIKYKNKIKCLL